MRTHLADLARTLRRELKERRIGIAIDDLGNETIEASFRDEATRKLAICIAITQSEKWHGHYKKPTGGDLRKSISKWNIE